MNMNMNMTMNMSTNTNTGTHIGMDTNTMDTGQDMGWDTGRDTDRGADRDTDRDRDRDVITTSLSRCCYKTVHCATSASQNSFPVLACSVCNVILSGLLLFSLSTFSSLALNYVEQCYHRYLRLTLIRMAGGTYDY
jgi:hypothetical protein